MEKEFYIKEIKLKDYEIPNFNISENQINNFL